MRKTKPEGVKFICLTPVVNEAFELDRFIQAALLWADHIILGYQPSVDNTLEIAQSYEKVSVINSPGKDWNELAMRSLLYEEARKIQAEKRIIFNLDADELISANFLDSAEWNTITELPVGSIVRMQWFNFLQTMDQGRPSNWIDVAFVDDGRSTMTGSIMHMGRVPWPNYDIKILKCHELKLLHYQGTNHQRSLSKVRWYNAYEKVGKGLYGPQIFRKYKRHDAGRSPIPVQNEWINGYSEKGIDVTSITEGYDYSHDYRILEYFKEYGTDYFKMCDIWGKDWVQFATGKVDNPEQFADPRNKFDKLIYRYMWWSVSRLHKSPYSTIIKIADRILKVLGYSH
jgi:hypothetical protein